MRELDRSHERCVQHFRQKYSLEDVPIWAVVEIASFGTLSLLYANLTDQMRKHISLPYGIRYDYLTNYLQHLTVLRNRCAHHARIFDFMLYKFSPLKEWRKTAPGLSDTRAIFYQALLVYRLLSPVKPIVFDREAWRMGMSKLMSSAPVMESVDFRRIMGVPPSPETSPLWV